MSGGSQPSGIAAPGDLTPLALVDTCSRVYIPHPDTFIYIIKNKSLAFKVGVEGEDNGHLLR